MKKILALCLTIVLSISLLISCGINNYKPISVKHQNSDYAACGDAFLTNLLNNSKWYNDVAKCECDYTILMENGREIFYHSECGTFIDYDFNKSLTISEEDRVKLNNYFVDSICRSEVHFFDENQRCTACGYDMSDEPLRVVNDLLRNQAGCEWLCEITAEDIAEVKIISEYVGVAPGTPKNISSSTDEAVIARIFGDCHFCEILSIPKSEGQIDGGGAVTVKFILKDGTVKELYINNGNYRDPNGNYFELLHTPHFEDTDNKSEYYGFITYIGRGTVYDKDNNTVCEIPINELEYVITGYDFSLFNNGYDYCVDTEFGKLYFVKVEIFSSEGDGLELVRVDYYFIAENDTEFCYRLVGKNLDKLIAEYSITAE